MNAQEIWEAELDIIGTNETAEVYEKHLAAAPDPGAPGTQYLAGFIMGQAQALAGSR
jgi:hypothetical protein